MKGFVALVLLALALSGCSGGSKPVELQANAAGEYEIHMPAGQNTFVPASAHAPAGATVVWVHDGGAPHDVYISRQDATGSTIDNSYGQFPSMMHEGDRYNHTFMETGTFDVNCHIHHGMMKGTIAIG